MEEIELTYLAKELPVGVKDSPCNEILDIYIPTVDGHPTLRIRKVGEKYEITEKGPLDKSDASHQFENTISLTAEEYEKLSQLKGLQTRKKRYYYFENGVNYEVDIFQDGLSGLVTVDVEFDSLDKKNNFIPPAWCLVDVTQEDFIAGGIICGKTYSNLEDDLRRFGYNKINE